MDTRRGTPVSADQHCLIDHCADGVPQRFHFASSVIDNCDTEMLGVNRIDVRTLAHFYYLLHAQVASVKMPIWRPIKLEFRLMILFSACHQQIVHLFDVVAHGRNPGCSFPA